MILTVAIPTYNRPDKVVNTIKLLLPQITKEVKVMVLDNGSQVIIKDYLETALGKDVIYGVEVVRNRVNIGADSNFQRCFELCTTPYIWMLGDDDRIEENAVETILLEVDEYKDQDLIGINFNSNCNIFPRPKPVHISSTFDLSTKLDHFGNWLFISTSVYKTEEYLKHTRYQAWGAYSMASQVVPAMIAISKNKTLILSEKYIVTNLKAEQDDSGGNWSDVQVTLAVLSLLESPVGFKKKEYLSFGKKLSVQFVSFTDLLCAIVKSIDCNMKLIDSYHLYLYRLIFHHTIAFRPNQFVSYTSYYIVLFFLRNSMLLNWLLKSSAKLKRRVELTPKFFLFEREILKSL